MQIVCDESGYEGEKLIGTTTDAFAHASVRMSAEAAADFIRELRDRIRSPATQYKANHVLREKHRAVLRWLLGPQAPLLGNVHVYLIDKEFYVVDKLLELLLESDRDAAARLCRQASREFLETANNLMRTKDRLDATTSVDEFYRALDVMREGRDDELLNELSRTRDTAQAFRDRMQTDPAMTPVLEPLIPAIVHAVRHWQAGEIVHDRQNVLTPERIAQIKAIVPDLTSLTLGDSGVDARIQVADIVAGAVRKIASDELANHGDPEFTAMLAPYVDRLSIWGDDRSLKLITGE